MWYPRGYQGSSHIWEELLGSLNSFKEVLNRLLMYGNGYSMAIMFDHRSTATSLTGNFAIVQFPGLNLGNIIKGTKGT